MYTYGSSLTQAMSILQSAFNAVETLLSNLKLALNTDKESMLKICNNWQITKDKNVFHILE